MTPQGTTVRDLVTRLLDRGYEQAVGPVLRAVDASVNAGVVDQRLTELLREAERLRGLDQRMTADNPILRATLADLEITLRRNAARIDAAGTDVQQQAVDAAARLTRELALPGLSDQQLASIGIRWNQPDPEAVMRAVGYTESAAWQAEIGKYVGGTVDAVQEAALRGIIAGANPITIAREVRRVTQGLTIARANNAMRTLQLTSYRTAAAIQQQANADILVEQIRIGTLDDRICLCCIALHGTRLPAGERVDDHHQGRCVGVPVVRGRPREAVTGVDWYNNLPEARKLEIAGPGAYELLRSGRARLRDFVAEYQDPVYGRMVREASLLAVRGE